MVNTGNEDFSASDEEQEVPKKTRPYAGQIPVFGVYPDEDYEDSFSVFDHDSGIIDHQDNGDYDSFADEYDYSSDNYSQEGYLDSDSTYAIDEESSSENESYRDSNSYIMDNASTVSIAPISEEDLDQHSSFSTPTSDSVSSDPLPPLSSEATVESLEHRGRNTLSLSDEQLLAPEATANLETQASPHDLPLNFPPSGVYDHHSASPMRASSAQDNSFNADPATEIRPTPYTGTAKGVAGASLAGAAYGFPSSGSGQHTPASQPFAAQPVSQPFIAHPASQPFIAQQPVSQPFVAHPASQPFAVPPASQPFMAQPASPLITAGTASSYPSSPVGQPMQAGNQSSYDSTDYDNHEEEEPSRKIAAGIGGVALAVLLTIGAINFINRDKEDDGVQTATGTLLSSTSSPKTTARTYTSSTSPTTTNRSTANARAATPSTRPSDRSSADSAQASTSARATHSPQPSQGSNSSGESPNAGNEVAAPQQPVEVLPEAPVVEEQVPEPAPVEPEAAEPPAAEQPVEPAPEEEVVPEPAPAEEPPVPEEGNPDLPVGVNPPDTVASDQEVQAAATRKR